MDSQTIHRRLIALLLLSIPLAVAIITGVGIGGKGYGYFPDWWVFIFTDVGPFTIFVAITAVGAVMSEQSSLSALAAIVSALLSIVLSLPYFLLASFALIAYGIFQPPTLVSVIYATNLIVALGIIYFAIAMSRLPARTGAPQASA